MPVNMDTARILYKKASDLGCGKAAYNLANMYKMGQGGEQDMVQAFNYFQKSLDLGFKKAYYKLGYFYYKGFGVAQDYTKAVEMFKKGSEYKNSNCDYFLGLCYMGGYGVEKDLEMGKKYIEKSVSNGSGQAVDFIDKDRIEKYKEKPQTRSAYAIDKQKPLTYRRTINTTDKDISGIWEGKMIKYDWSGKHIVEEKNLSLQIDNTEGSLSGIWVQEDTVSIKLQAHKEASSWVFDNMKYTHAYERVWEVKQGKFELQQTGDSILLLGNVEQYSVDTKEPSSPTSVVLKRSASISNPQNRASIRNSLIVYPNPFDRDLSVQLSLSEAQKLTLFVYDQEGKEVYNQTQNWEQGTHTQQLQLTIPTGVYTLSAKGDKVNLNSLLIKK
jgi:hypothetical protein